VTRPSDQVTSFWVEIFPGILVMLIYLQPC